MSECDSGWNLCFKRKLEGKVIKLISARCDCQFLNTLTWIIEYLNTLHFLSFLYAHANMISKYPPSIYNIYDASHTKFDWGKDSFPLGSLRWEKQSSSYRELRYFHCEPDYQMKSPFRHYFQLIYYSGNWIYWHCQPLNKLVLIDCFCLIEVSFRQIL